MECSERPESLTAHRAELQTSDGAGTRDGARQGRAGVQVGDARGADIEVYGEVASPWDHLVDESLAGPVSLQSFRRTNGLTDRYYTLAVTLAQVQGVLNALTDGGPKHSALSLGAGRIRLDLT